MTRLRTLTALTILGCLALVAGWLVSTGKITLLKKPAEAAVAPSTVKATSSAVTVVKTAPADLVETVMVTGTVVPREEILIGPEVEGLRIIEVLADEGMTVKKGQILARLVNDTLEAQLAQNDAAKAKAVAGIAQARSTIVSAEAKLVEAQNAFDRGKPLRKTGYIAESVQDQRESAAKSAEAQVVSARDGLKVAEADKAQIDAQRRELDWKRSRTDIMAPVDGVVSRRVARIGGFAAGSGDPMFRIIAAGEVELDAEIPEARVGRIRPGQSVRVEGIGTGEVIGTVRLVSPEIDKTTRLGRIRVFLGANPALRIGAFARGTIETAKSRGLSVPVTAVLYGDGNASVQVVGPNNTIETRRIHLGLTHGGLIEVTDGLKDGDLVVAKSGTFLRDGDAVRPIFENRKVTEVRP